MTPLPPITALDPTNQHAVLSALPAHIRDGWRIAMEAELPQIAGDLVSTVLVCGMGGSAISGDILRNLAHGSAAVPIQVLRQYDIPAWVDARTLVFIMSYSGGTEETVSAARQAHAAGARIIAITSGADFAASVRADGHAAVTIPGGFAPRAAVGYLCFALLGVASRLGIRPIDAREVEAAAVRAARLVAACTDPADAANPARAVAERLHGRLPVIYSSPVHEAANLRWRCQIEENAKTIAHGHILPELNHNEIVGWEQQPDLLSRIALILFTDPADSAPIRLRMDVTRRLLAPLAGDVIDIPVEGSSPLERTIHLICLGDWVSWHLAVGTGVDPFPIVKINLLKEEMKGRRA